jgi:Protein of unknown function (DUF2868)
MLGTGHRAWHFRAHMAHSPRWHLADLLDFESLHGSDAERAEDALRTRDREIFARVGEAEKADRRTVFRRWLEARREQEKAGLPGETARTGWEALIAIAVIAGLALGAGVCAAVLQYPGGEPVNVAFFLGAILGPQFVLPLIFGALWLLLRWRVGSPALSRVLCWLGGALRRLPGEQRVRVQTAFAAMERREEIYGALGKWPVFIATQIFAVAFNVGAIGALLAHVPTRELRFGWQTTLEVSSAQVAPLVALVAAPWRWAPHAHPTAEQVVATRFAPGQSLATLPGEAARAWWPFLAYAIGCYGLVLRSTVLIFAVWRLRSGLGALRFDHAEANALWRRMTGPLVAAPGATATLTVPESAASSAAHAPAGGAIWMLVAHDTAAPDADLASAAEHAHGWRATRTQRVKIDHRHDEAALFSALAAATPRPDAVVVAVPAERDPIVAVGLFLREVQRAAEKAEVLVWLIGASAERRKYWRDFLAIQRLPIGVELAPLP